MTLTVALAITLLPGSVDAQTAISFKPDSIASEWIFGWVKPSNATHCELSGGNSTIMMICDNYQLLANHTKFTPPSKIKSAKMNNTGIANIYEYDYRTDKRMMLQRNATGGVTGNLLLFDAYKREWTYLFLFSTYYDIDWLSINEREGFIGYRVNNFKVQWWFNYRGYSKVTRIFSNMWESNQTNWNMITNNAGQIGSNGQLKYTGLAWDATDTLVPTVQTLAGYNGEQIKVISNAGRTYWAASNPDTNRLLVFAGNTQIFAFQ